MCTLSQKHTKSDPSGVSSVSVAQTPMFLAPVKPTGPVAIRNMQSVRYVYSGETQRYVFPPAGTLPVNRKDVPKLLAKLSRGGGCCGFFDPGGRPLFMEV